VQETKRFDIVCSMEVVEHVDNPAAFLRSCAELVKVRLFTALPLAHLSSSMSNLLLLPARWTPFLVYDCQDAAVLFPHYLGSRESVTPRRARYTHLFEIRQS